MPEESRSYCPADRLKHDLFFHRQKLTSFISSAKAIWDFEGIFCSSRHIPHVRFPGLIHPGILGCAPSAEVLATWNKRESELISATEHMDRVTALPPQPQNVHAGSATGDLKEKVGKEGARTVPGRPEHGGNCDIKNLSRGSKVFLPVHVTGAKFSVGDLHFSQGDGEISFCGAIEIAGVITLKLSVMKNGMDELSMKSPIFLPGPVEPHYGPGRYLTFEGFSVDHTGKQHYLDATVAYRETTLRVIEYLKRFGKALLLLSMRSWHTYINQTVLIRFSLLLSLFRPLRNVLLMGKQKATVITKCICSSAAHLCRDTLLV